MGERWEPIPDFPMYEISDRGNIYNHRTRRLMSPSQTTFGYGKISLMNSDGVRHTRSVALLVAQAFVRPPTILCTKVILLDGNLFNFDFKNLEWRPRGFAWEYRHQLLTEQPRHLRNLPVYNLTRDLAFDSVIDAGMEEGLLFKDIWRSTYSGSETFPYKSVFEIIK